jgi:hypothetical protein
MVLGYLDENLYKVGAQSPTITRTSSTSTSYVTVVNLTSSSGYLYNIGGLITVNNTATLTATTYLYAKVTIDSTVEYDDIYLTVSPYDNGGGGYTVLVTHAPLINTFRFDSSLKVEMKLNQATNIASASTVVCYSEDA